MPVTPTTMQLISLAVRTIPSTVTSFYYNETVNRMIIVKEILLTNTNSTEVSVNIYFANKSQIVSNAPTSSALVYDTLTIQGKDTIAISLTTFLDYEASIWMNASVADKVNVRISGVIADFVPSSYI